jgi:hypothetical protein
MIHFSRDFVPFWDDTCIDSARTSATLSVNRPQRAGSVLRFDQPWEGDSPDYFTIIRDGGLYRMYYNGFSLNESDFPARVRLCYAESTDGIHWVKPDLGMYEINGSRHNNVIMPINDNFTVMIDQNPACPPEHRYKALLEFPDISTSSVAKEGQKGLGLLCMTSADGLHFNEHSIISTGLQYDSQNTLHYNPHLGKYYAFMRGFRVVEQTTRETLNETSVRSIYVSESEDFVRWSEPVPLDFGEAEDCPLYTNCVSAYPYDDRLYIGFPTRYVERKEWTPNYDRLCGKERRLERMKLSPRLGTVVTDCVFMHSRDMFRWHRFDEAFMIPGPENGLNWIYGDCYPAFSAPIETQADLPGEPPELSMYAVSNHFMPEPSELIRYTVRRDGFASYKATYKPQVLTTLPFTFESDVLALNFRTSARGYIIVRVLTEGGDVIPGYETCELFGDALARPVDFPSPLGELSGRAVRIEFTMSDAEVYAMRFL